MKNTFKLIAVAVALTAAVACSGNKTAESTTGADTAATAETTNDANAMMADTTAAMATDTATAMAADTAAH